MASARQAVVVDRVPAAAAVSAGAATPAKDKAVFFPALNSLRFIGACAIFFCHIEAFKDRAGVPSPVNTTLRHEFGIEVVQLFFLLTSFLLTYLLLQEVRKTGTVQARQFYIRRALRTWPLYYAVTFICFFIVPFAAPVLFHHNEALYVSATVPTLVPSFFLFICMLPNLSLVLFPFVEGAAHFWSLGVQEQYYVLLPGVVKLLRRKPFLVGAALICMFQAVSLGAQCLIKLYPGEMPGYAKTLCEFGILVCRDMHMMGVGALAAVMYFYWRNRPFIAALYHPLARIFILASVCFMALNPHLSPDTLRGVTFAALVLTLTDPTLRIMSSRVLVYLGTISYGIYVWHLLVICCFMKLAESLNLTTLNLVLYLGSLPVTILVSIISYEYFEKPFLRLKGRFTIIQSGVPNLLLKNGCKNGVTQ